MFANVIGISRRRAAEEGKLRPPLRYRLTPNPEPPPPNLHHRSPFPGGHALGHLTDAGQC